MSTVEEIEERHDWLVKQILKRIRKPLIKAMYRSHFGLSDATFNSDFKEAWRMIKSSRDQENLEDRFAAAVCSREELISQAWRKDDPSLSFILSAERDLAELEGLYKKKEGDGASVVFNFGGLPVASSDDGPVGEEQFKEFLDIVEEADEESEDLG